MLEREKYLHILERRISKFGGVLSVRVIDVDERACFARNRAEDPVWSDPAVKTVRSEAYFGRPGYKVEFVPDPDEH